jgi:H+/gluconate symporter-like permease
MFMSDTLKTVLVIAFIWAVLTVVFILAWHWLRSIKNENMSSEWRREQAKKNDEGVYGEKEKRP